MENKNIDSLVVEAKAKELKREYMRAWHKNNKGRKNAEYQRRYWAKKAEEELKVKASNK